MCPSLNKVSDKWFPVNVTDFLYWNTAGQEWSAIGKDRKSRPMQQEDEYRLHMELNRCLKKDTITGATDQDLFESQTTRTVSSRG